MASYVEQMSKLADQLFYDLSIKYDSNDTIRRRIEELLKFGLEVAAFAHEYDYANVQSNGYRSLIRLVIALLRKGLTLNRSMEGHFEDMLGLFVDGIEHVRTLRADSLTADRELDGRPPVASSYGQIMYNLLRTFSKTENGHFEVLFGPLNDFSSDENSIYLNYLLMTGNGATCDVVKAMNNSDKKTRMLAKMYKRYDFDLIKKQLNEGSTGFFYTKVLNFGLNWFSPSVKRTLFIPRQSKWQIKCDVIKKRIDMVDNGNDYQSEGVRSDVRVRYLYEPSVEPVLLVYAHGGGFISNSAESHDVFLRGWCSSIPGLAILNVDYSLSPEVRFPEPIQQVLDVYLWATSGEASVTAELGFRPKKVALGGDSSGALMTMSVLTAVNDIRRMNSNSSKVPLPVGFLGIYSSFTMAPHVLPSFLLSPFNPLLFPTIILNMCAAYHPVSEKSEDANSNQVGQGPQDIFELLKVDGALEKYFKDNLELLSHHYMSPANYAHFDDLKDVKLKLFALQNDPVLDNSVLMARKWRGNCSLDVVDDLNHGFLNMIFLQFYSKQRRLISESSQLMMRRLRDIFDLNADTSLMTV